MNPYFLIVYIISFVVEGWSISTLIGYLLSGIKYFRIFISMLTPEPKGTVESLRGFIKVTYYSDDGDGFKKRYVLLPTNGKEMTWFKVEAVLHTDYKEYLERLLEIPANLPLPTDRVSAETNAEIIQTSAPVETGIATMDLCTKNPSEKKTDEADLLDDIEAVASGKDTSSRAVRTRKEKVISTPAKKYRNCPKVDITDEILLHAGPNKDFFQVKLTPRDLSSSYQALVFHYNRGQKTFDRDDVLVFI